MAANFTLTKAEIEAVERIKAKKNAEKEANIAALEAESAKAPRKGKEEKEWRELWQASNGVGSEADAAREKVAKIKKERDARICEANKNLEDKKIEAEEKAKEAGKATEVVASAKVRLTAELWNKLSTEEYQDFDNLAIREKAHSLVVAYYLAIAQLSDKKVEKLKQEDYLEIMEFLETQFNEDSEEFQRVAGIILYSGVRSSQWPLRFDSHPSKQLLRSEFLSKLYPAKEEKEAFIIGILEIALPHEEAVEQLVPVIFSAQAKVGQDPLDLLTEKEREELIISFKSNILDKSKAQDGSVRGKGLLGSAVTLDLGESEIGYKFVKDKLVPKFEALIDKKVSEKTVAGPQSFLVERQEDKSELKAQIQPDTLNSSSQKEKVEKLKGNRGTGLSMGGLAVLGLGVCVLAILGPVAWVGAIIALGAGIAVAGVLYPDNRVKTQERHSPVSEKKPEELPEEVRDSENDKSNVVGLGNAVGLSNMISDSDRGSVATPVQRETTGARVVARNSGLGTHSSFYPKPDQPQELNGSSPTVTFGNNS